MSDDVKQLLSELDGSLDNQEVDVSTDAAKVLDDESNQEGDADGDKAKAREKALKDQASAWAIKLLQEGKTIDELPEAQVYLKPHVKVLLEKPTSKEREKKAEEKPSMTVSEQVEYTLTVQSLQSAVREGLLSAEERKKLKARIERETEKGLNPSKALKEALEICGIDLMGLKPRIRAADEIKTGSKSGSKEFTPKTGAEIGKLSPSELAKYREEVKAFRAASV